MLLECNYINETTYMIMQWSDFNIYSLTSNIQSRRKTANTANLRLPLSYIFIYIYIYSLPTPCCLEFGSWPFFIRQRQMRQ